MMNRTEQLMDAGFGSCVFRKRQCSDPMSKSLLHFQDVRYRTSCFTVMPNHVHAVTKPFEGFELEDCLQRIKQYVATHVNRLLEQTGQLWAEESYDRIIRDEEHLWNVVQYIGRNPRKAGLPRDEWIRWIDPEWEALGWGFQDE